MIPYVPPNEPSEHVTSNPPPPRRNREEGIQEGRDVPWPDGETPADDLVAVASFAFLHEAELAKLRLAEENIQAFIMDETETLDRLLGSNFSNIEIQVSASQVERAEAVLQQFRPQPDADPIPESGAFPCLACGAAILRDQTKCPACGWSYTDEGIQAAP